MATITIKSDLTPEHTLPIDFERFCQHGQTEQHFPLLIKTFGKREPGEVLEVCNRAGRLKLRLVYDAGKSAYADMTHSIWSKEYGRWMTYEEHNGLLYFGKRYKLCCCTREISTSTRYDRQRLVEQLHPGCTTKCDSYDLSTVILQTFDAVNDTMQAVKQCRDEAMQALEAVGEPVRYSDCGDYFWVEEHFVEEYDVLLNDEDEDEEIEDFTGIDYCKWPGIISIWHDEYAWSPSENRYVLIPVCDSCGCPDGDDDDDDDDDACEQLASRLGIWGRLHELEYALLHVPGVARVEYDLRDVERRRLALRIKHCIPRSVCSDAFEQLAIDVYSVTVAHDLYPVANEADENSGEYLNSIRRFGPSWFSTDTDE